MPAKKIPVKWHVFTMPELLCWFLSPDRSSVQKLDYGAELSIRDLQFLTVLFSMHITSTIHTGYSLDIAVVLLILIIALTVSKTCQRKKKYLFSNLNNLLTI